MDMSKRWDVFISYAHEDRPFVEKLARALSAHDISVWFDQTALRVGDSLSGSIQHGLSESRYGIVVLSNNFIAKRWPQMELGALIALEGDGKNRILPVWHNISSEEVRQKAPLLADRLAASSRAPFSELLDDLMIVISNRRKWQVSSIEWPDGGVMIPIPLRHTNGVFVLGQSPVTNAQYRRFVDARHHAPPRGEAFTEAQRQWSGPFDPWTSEAFNGEDQPVVCVSFEDAYAYCSWVNGLLPHGRAFLPNAELWQYAALADAAGMRSDSAWRDTQTSFHHNATAPASTSKAEARSNLWGLTDMFGNVWEWCLSGEREHFFLAPPPIAVVQGGGFLDKLNEPYIPNLSASELPSRSHTKHTDLGFRVGGIVPLSMIERAVAGALASAPRGDDSHYLQ
jgi:hypothetical protein